MEAYLSMITPYGCNFVIRNWAACAGSLIPINQNTALYSLLGTNYGGDGVNTFGLPDLRGRRPVSWGHAPGLSPVTLGQVGGAQYRTLTQSQMPAHEHSVSTSGSTLATAGSLAVSTDAAGEADPNGNYLGTTAAPILPYAATLSNPAGAQQDVVDIPARSVSFNGNTMANGGSQSFYMESPYQGVNYQICIAGIFPSRS